MLIRRRKSHYEQFKFERECVIRLREGDFSFRYIAERLGRNVFTVHDCWKQWSMDGTTPRRLCSRKPRGTIAREDRRIQGTAVTHRTEPATEIRAAVGTTLSQLLLH
ncbi:uncharacterized protein TNCV_3771441 [Trichonephila clavipes]|nr:uncharacterized protein TNCV_3771441 [Trichonephila clavipes]